jgi:hypothetical protein
MAEKQLSGSELDIVWFEMWGGTMGGDITPHIINVSIYEDMFGNFLSADVLINDSLNFPVNTPIVGQEHLRFKFRTKSMDVGSELNAGDMQVVSIKKRYLVKERQQVYMLHAISAPGMSMLSQTISKSYRGMGISNIVHDIYENYFDTDYWDNLIVEQTKGIDNIIIPNWKVRDALNWLAKRAVNKNDCANYLSYERLNDEDSNYPDQVFESVESAVVRPPKQRFIYSAGITDTKKLIKTAQGISELLDLRIANQFNVIHNMTGGYYASKLVTHDIVKKKIRQQTHSITDVFIPDINHTDTYMPIRANMSVGDMDNTVGLNYRECERVSLAPEDLARAIDGVDLENQYDNKIMFYPKHDRMYAKNKTDLYDNEVEKWKLNRNTMIQGLNQIKLMITFTGLSKLHAGNMIEVIVPAAQKVIEEQPGSIKNKEELIDKQLSGKYLITTLKHTVTRADNTWEYICRAEVVKDGIGSAP